MSLLVAGLVVFFAVHLLPAAPALRNRLIGALGEKPYRGLYSLVALGAFVLIVVGYARAPFEPGYAPPAWGRAASMVLMAPAFILLVAAYVPNNIRRVTAHPMLWGTLLWASGHLLANGDKAGLLLFGSFGAYALVDMGLATRRGARPSRHKSPVTKDLAVVLLGLVVYATVFALHGTLFGVPLG